MDVENKSDSFKLPQSVNFIFEMYTSCNFILQIYKMNQYSIIICLISIIVLVLGDNCQYTNWSDWNGWCSTDCTFAVQYRERNEVNNRDGVECTQPLTEDRPCPHKCKAIKLITHDAEVLAYQLGVEKMFEFENSRQSFGSLLNCDESCENFSIQDRNVCVSCLNKEDCMNMPQVSELVTVHFITRGNSTIEDIIQTPCNCFLHLRTIHTKGVCDSEGYYKTYTIWN